MESIQTIFNSREIAIGIWLIIAIIGLSFMKPMRDAMKTIMFGEYPIEGKLFLKQKIDYDSKLLEIINNVMCLSEYYHLYNSLTTPLQSS